MASWARKSTVRRSVAVAVVAVSAALASVAFGTAAGALEPPAGEGQPESPGACVWAFTPVAADGGIVPGATTVSVTQVPAIDEPLTVQLFLDGSVVQSRVVTPPPSLPIAFDPVDVTAGDSVAVNYILRGVSTYSTGCATVAGQTVVRAGGVSVSGVQASRALAFTGSSSTRTMVLVAVTVLALGLVFVIGSRRRQHVNA